MLDNVYFFLAEESETEAQTGSVDTWNECESMQKLASDEDNFNSGSTSSLADLDGNRCRYIITLITVVIALILS